MRALVFTLLAAGLTGITSQGYAEEQYVCVSDGTVGFVMKKSNTSWEPFVTQTARKYVVRKLEQESAFRNKGYGLFYLGAPNEIAGCAIASEGFACRGVINMTARFDTGRFVAHSLGGYLFDKDDEYSEDAPFLEIGNCSKME